MVLWYESLNGPLLHSTYKIGDTVSFPVDEMTLTICNMTISKTTTVPNLEYNDSQSVFVVFTVAIRNVANHEIYFNRSDDFTDRFAKAVSGKTFVLTYGAENHEAYALTSAIAHGWSAASVESLYWFSGINKMYSTQIDSMTPNQIIYGVIFFTIGQYYTPNELILREGYQPNPIFTVNLR